MRLSLTHATGMALCIWAGILPMAAQAYVGPGAGLTAIGTMIALLAALVLAVVGFVWYPIKRMMRSKAPADIPDNSEQPK
ncbi:hypothetical protein BC777_0291 [Yoonia maricola]|uniref:Uncharacterized protein n=1 Tax=Yoonia maricola TaxID=420999 RepID=A0A2M8WKJ2_9RHOB|nr:hypothetical protein [Yoonia maricola]PJI91463.1 hypothetical protein BC777_0291 [Yoonia maricola]